MSKIEIKMKIVKMPQFFTLLSFCFLRKNLSFFVMKTIPTDIDLIDKERKWTKSFSKSLSNSKLKHF